MLSRDYVSSVLEQSHQDVRILVIDDASPDDTAEIARAREFNGAPALPSSPCRRLLDACPDVGLTFGDCLDLVGDDVRDLALRVNGVDDSGHAAARICAVPSLLP